MSLYRKLDCAYKYWVHTLHKQLLCDKLDRIPARTDKRDIDKNHYLVLIHLQLMLTYYPQTKQRIFACDVLLH